MLKKVIEICNVGRFAVLRSEGGNEAELSKYNVIYANNGAGKSTLCDILRSLDKRDGSYIEGRRKFGAITTPKIKLLVADNTRNQSVQFTNGQWSIENSLPIYVYDERFVRENIYLGDQVSVQHRRHIYNLALGQEGVRLNAEVERAARQYETAKAEFEVAESNLRRLVPAGYTIDTFRNLEPLDSEQQVAALEQELQTARAQCQQREKILNKASLEMLPTAEVPAELPSILVETIDELARSAEGHIKQHLNTHTNGSLALSWFQMGAGAVSGDVCPFCGQSLVGNRLLDEYKSYFSEAVKDFEERRNDVKIRVRRAFGNQAVQQMTELIRSNSDSIEWWNDVCHLPITCPSIDSCRLAEKMSDTCNTLLDVLGRKEGCLSNAVTVLQTEQGVLDSWCLMQQEINKYNISVNAANQIISQYQASVNLINTTTLEQQLETTRYRQKRHTDDVVNAYSNYDLKLQSKQAAQRAKTAANNALKTQSEQLFSQYGERINRHLEAFGVSFRVRNQGIDMRGGASGNLSLILSGTEIDCSGNAASDPARASLANTLSGGDRSALALAYFLSFVEGAHEVERSIIVFDDPYQSQDRSRCQMTISKIECIAKSAAQCIVFSHNEEFANQVFRIHIGENDKRMFAISSVGETVSLRRKNPTGTPTSSYELDYQSIMDYINQPTDEQSRLLAVVRSIRQILEAYLRSKFVGVFGENVWLGGMIESIRSATETNNPILKRKDGDTLVDELTCVNNYTARYHHGDRGDMLGVPDAQELLVHAKQTLAIIRR